MGIKSFACLLAFAALLGGCAPVGRGASRPGSEPPPVVVIALDELPTASLMDRSGSIDDELFPNFAHLQKSSTWFRNATTSATFTHEVMPSILTGSEPSERLEESSFVAENLFMLLAGTHDLYTTQPFPRFCPVTLCRPMPRAPADEPLRKDWPAFSAGDRGEKFLSLASFLAPTERPRLYFAHFVMPHQPWAYLPSGGRYPSADFLPGQVDVPGRGKGWTDHWWLTAQAMQRHLLQTRFTDALLGALIDRMRERGIWEEALVIVMADHGIAFQPGFPKRIATPTTAGQLAHVPLFVKRPHQEEAKVTDAPVSVTDVAPTIADVVGLDYKSRSIDGRSLFHRRGVRIRTRRVNDIPLPNDLSALEEAVVAKYKTFETVGDSLDLFRVGSNRVRELVGSRIDDIDPLPRLSLTHVSNQGVLVDAERRAPMLPSLLHGTIAGPPEDRSLIAVVLDGRIAAFTPTYVSAGTTHFYCMVPPRLLGRGGRVEIYRVTDGSEWIADVGRRRASG